VLFHLIKEICPDHTKRTNLSFLIKIGFVFLFFLSSEVQSATHETHTAENYNKDKAFEFSQSAINRTIGSYKFLNQDKKPIDITQYRGKPLIVSLIYTSCHHICPTLTNNLADIVEIAQEALGEESFSVVTIGFDTAADSPERMRLFARERNINIPAWDFLSTDSNTIEAFTNDMGFIFFKSPKGFDHLSQISLLDADGRVYRQIYGVQYEPPQLIEPLKELVFGKRTEVNMVEGWINNIRLFCTIYDPHSGRYEFDYSIFIGIAMGIIILGAIAIFLVREWRNNKINRPS
jgi:protein SCO1